MKGLLPGLCFCLAVFTLSDGVPKIRKDLPCGEWIPFKNEKCVKLVSKAALQTKEDAEVICNTFVEELHVEDVPKLATVKTEEKQKFLEKLLFEELEILDNVWLGLDLERDGVFRWNDGTDLFFTNWAENGKEESHDRNCIQMESGEGTIQTGKWAKVNCKKRNAVVCERDQPWTVSTLQNSLLSLKLQVERNKQELSNLTNNPVPIGFLYVQLPGQNPPTTLWPQVRWKDVGQDYAGLFFRVEGGNAAPFGQEQQDNTRHFVGVQNAPNFDVHGINPLPIDGSWSQYVYTGRNQQEPNHNVGVRFLLNPGEVRPQNKAVKIWQRIQ